MIAWTDADCSGNAMTCKSTSAGAVQLESHQIEAWSVVQQVVSFSSAESETYAIEASKVDRWETLDHRQNQDCRIGKNPRLVPKTRLSERSKLLNMYQTRLTVSTKGPNVRERPKRNSLGLAKRSSRRRRRPRLLKIVGNLEKNRLRWPSLHSRVREPPDKISLGLDTLENAKESPSDLDTRGPGKGGDAKPREPDSVVPVTSRFATPWSTRAQWSCCGFICGLARPDSASGEVIVNGYWSKRVNRTTPGVMEATDSISTFAVNAGAGGTVAGAMLVRRVAMSSCSERSQQTRPSAGVQPSARKREIERSVRQVDWRVLSAHR